MQEKYYVSHNEERVGPFTIAEIQRKLDATELFPTDYVYVEARQDWVMLAEFVVEAAPPAPRSAVEIVKPMVAVDDAEETTPPPLDDLTPVEKTQTDFVLAQDEEDLDPSFNFESATVVGASSLAAFSASTLAPEMKATRSEPAATPAQAPSVAAAVQHSNPSPSSEWLKAPQFEFKGGQAQVKFTAHVAEKIALKVKPEGGDLETSGSAEIVFKAGPAHELRFEAAKEAIVGNPVEIVLQAYDRFGNSTDAFHGRARLEATGGADIPKEAFFKNGRASFSLHHTKAETLEFRAVPIGEANLTVKGPFSLRLQAGPAVRLVIEPPKEIRAGEEAVVRILAVDRYGNVDTNFKGGAHLAIEGLENHQPLELVDGVIRTKVS